VNVHGIGNNENVDRDLDSIKPKILNFQGKSDPEAYLEWEKKVDWIFFYCCSYLDARKVQLAIIEFIDYALIWWYQYVIGRSRNRERLIALWVEMKVLMMR